jgi:hypothetical protein
MSHDGVHYFSEGYANLADNCVTAIKETVRKSETAPVTSSQQKHFWRGFRSTVGAKLASRSVVAVVTSLVVLTEARTGAGLAGISILIERTRMLITWWMLTICIHVHIYVR